MMKFPKPRELKNLKLWQEIPEEEKLVKDEVDEEAVARVVGAGLIFRFPLASFRSEN